MPPWKMDPEEKEQMHAKLELLKRRSFEHARREHDARYCSQPDSEEEMTDSDMQQIRKLFREELAEVRTRLDSLSLAVESSKSRRSASNAKSLKLTSDQERIAENLTQVSLDWNRKHGANKPLEPSDIKAAVKALDYDLGVKLAEKSTWNKLRAWMLDQQIFREQKGKTNASTVYFVGAAVTDGDEVQGIGSRSNGQQEAQH